MATSSIFGQSVLALKRLRERFIALDQEANDLAVSLIQTSNPPPDLRDWLPKPNGVSLVHSESAIEILKWKLADPARHSRSSRRVTAFDAIPQMIDLVEARSVLSGWSVPTTTREYLIFPEGRESEAKKLQLIAGDCASLLRNVISHADSSAYSQLWPELPTQVGIRNGAGVWFDLVFEATRWGLPSMSRRSHGMVRCETDLKIELPFVISNGNLWSDPNWLPPILRISMDRFPNASIEVIDLLIQWGETGVNPFQSRVDARQRQQTTCLDLWHFIARKLAEGQPSDMDELKANAESLSALLVQETSELGIRVAPFQWREIDPDGHRRDVHLMAKRDRQTWLESIQEAMRVGIFERSELPSGWEPSVWGESSMDWPRHPIENVENLRGWLSGWLGHVQSVNSGGSWFNPEGSLEGFRRELRNARRAMRALNITVPPGFDDQPTDIQEAERQLEGLIDGLTKSADEKQPEAISDPPKAGETPAGVDDAGGGQTNLRPCDRTAGSQHKRAIEDNPELKTDRAAYDWYVEYLADEGETLPAFGTWAKYVRNHRADSGSQKNKRGVGNETRSVVSGAKIEHQKRTEADFH